MPPATFALLLLTVIAAGGVTVALALWAGVPLVALGLAVLLLSLWPGLRRWK
jgi:TRAP-type mannitol/chloroaromatic compound transport system permease large subunit